MLGETKTSWTAKRREATRDAILAAAWDVAHEQGLASLTLREVAERVGMRAPSLYSHFDSKHAIYDAMFGQAWVEWLRLREVQEETLSAEPRAALRAIARAFFIFAVADPDRYQLMNARVLPGFEPSAESYAHSALVYDLMRARFARIGITDQTDLDLYTAVISGLVSQQLANDPGGDRWARQVDRAMEMYADAVGLPKETP